VEGCARAVPHVPELNAWLSLNAARVALPHRFLAASSKTTPASPAMLSALRAARPLPRALSRPPAAVAPALRSFSGFGLSPRADADADVDASANDGPPTGDPTLFARAPPSGLRNPVTRASATFGDDSATNIIQHFLHVRVTRNNIIVTLCNEQHRPVRRGWWSGGSVGFKGKAEAGYEAGYQCTVRAFARMKEILDERPATRFEIMLSGSGPGRESVLRSLLTSEGADVRDAINRVTDTTPIKIGGCRAKKARRM
jgi:small subunit ribosomal protein S11